MIIKRQYLLIFLLGLFLLVFAASFFLHPKRSSARKRAPLPKATSSADLQNKIKQQILSAMSNNEAVSGSVYVKNFKTSEEIMVNIQFKYTPASLLKVPLAMSFYKLAEPDPRVLDTTLTYTADPAAETIIQDFIPEEELVEGESYSLRELIRRMLIYSDNKAMRLLLTQIHEDQFIDVYKKLNVDLPTQETTDNYMFTRDYVRFFESLYHADYNTKADSETILDLLSQSTFKKGLQSGIPNGIRIAHKFGERAVQGENIKQLHDCGIVYAEKAPYTICVMMKGKDFPEEQNTIGKISALVYKYMSKQGQTP